MMYSDLYIWLLWMGLVHQCTNWKLRYLVWVIVSIFDGPNDPHLLVFRLSVTLSPWALCFWPLKHGSIEEISLPRFGYTDCELCLAHTLCLLLFQLVLLDEANSCSAKAHMARHWGGPWPIACKEPNAAYSRWVSLPQMSLQRDCRRGLTPWLQFVRSHEAKNLVRLCLDSWGTASVRY